MKYQIYSLICLSLLCASQAYAMDGQKQIKKEADEHAVRMEEIRRKALSDALRLQQMTRETQAVLEVYENKTRALSAVVTKLVVDLVNHNNPEQLEQILATFVREEQGEINEAIDAITHGIRHFWELRDLDCRCYDLRSILYAFDLKEFWEIRKRIAELRHNIRGKDKQEIEPEKKTEQKRVPKEKEEEKPRVGNPDILCIALTATEVEEMDAQSKRAQLISRYPHLGESIGCAVNDLRIHETQKNVSEGTRYFIDGLRLLLSGNEEDLALAYQFFVKCKELKGTSTADCYRQKLADHFRENNIHIG